MAEEEEVGESWQKMMVALDSFAMKVNMCRCVFGGIIKGVSLQHWCLVGRDN